MKPKSQLFTNMYSKIKDIIDEIRVWTYKRDNSIDDDRVFRNQIVLAIICLFVICLCLGIPVFR